MCISYYTESFNIFTYIKLRAQMVPIEKPCLRCNLLFELEWQLWIDTEVLVVFLEDLLKNNHVVRKQLAIQILCRWWL